MKIIIEPKPEQRNLQSKIDASLYDKVNEIRQLNGHKLKDVIEACFRNYIKDNSKPTILKGERK